MIWSRQRAALLVSLLIFMTAHRIRGQELIVPETEAATDSNTGRAKYNESSDSGPELILEPESVGETLPENALGNSPEPVYELSDPEFLFVNPLLRQSDADLLQSEIQASRPEEIPEIPAEKPSAAPYRGGEREDIQVLKESDDSRNGISFLRKAREPYRDYRVDESSWTWIPGSGDDFGWFSLLGSTWKPRGPVTGMGGTINIHWLAGPGSSPLPPRLYDFALGFQSRESLSERFSYDVSAGVGIYSDFEASARDGIRFPAHATGMVHINSTTDFIFGADYLDRDDIPVLPVAGFSFHDQFVRGLRMDLVFPRPQIEYALSDTWRSYLRGTLDGGTWDIEFPNGSDQVMTCRDYRLLLGFEHAEEDGSLKAIEFGYVFGRELSFRGVSGSTDFDDAFVLQFVWRN